MRRIGHDDAPERPEAVKLRRALFPFYVCSSGRPCSRSVNVYGTSDATSPACKLPSVAAHGRPRYSARDAREECLITRGNRRPDGQLEEAGRAA